MLEELEDVLLLQQLGVGADGAVAGHLVVLDPLGGGDEGRIPHLRLGVLLDRLLALLDQALDGLAGLLVGLLAEGLEGLLKPRHLVLGLRQMLLEGGLEIGRGSGLRHPGQRFGDPILGVLEILELFDQEVAQ